jgi:hypothetical protein
MLGSNLYEKWKNGWWGRMRGPTDTFGLELYISLLTPYAGDLTISFPLEAWLILKHESSGPGRGREERKNPEKLVILFRLLQHGQFRFESPQTTEMIPMRSTSNMLPCSSRTVEINPGQTPEGPPFLCPQDCEARKIVHRKHFSRA